MAAEYSPQTPAESAHIMGAAHIVSSPFDRFDEVVCINLDSRPDRWAVAQRGFRRVGLHGRVVRMPAVVTADRNPGLGCKLSHLRLIAGARERGAGSILIFEDDVVFAWRAVRALRRALVELERIDWQMLYLGLDFRVPPTRVSRHLLRTRGAHDNHAYAVHRSAFDFILARVSLEDDQHYHGYPDAVDAVFASEVHPHLNCLAVDPMICWQRPGYSDIQCDTVDRRDLRRKFARAARRAQRERIDVS